MKNASELGAFMFAFWGIILLGVGLETMMQGLFFGDVWNFDEFSFIEWVAQLAYTMCVIGLALVGGYEINQQQQR